MTFEETKKFINNNEEAIGLISPDLNLYPLLTKMLQILEKAIEDKNEETKPEALGNEMFEEINGTLDRIMEISIDTEYTSKERELLFHIMLIFSNFNELYSGCLDRPWLLRVWSLLLAEERTIDDSIFLNRYLLNKLRSEIFEESSATLLSKKYFDEYQAFLKEKNHDDDYSIRC